MNKKVTVGGIIRFSMHRNRRFDAELDFPCKSPAKGDSSFVVLVIVFCGYITVRRAGSGRDFYLRDVEGFSSGLLHVV